MSQEKQPEKQQVDREQEKGKEGNFKVCAPFISMSLF